MTYRTCIRQGASGVSLSFIQGLETDMETLAAHPHPTDGFTGMEVRGDTLTDKENAGAALLDACKEVKGSEPVQVGSYRGFAMFVTFAKRERPSVLEGLKRPIPPRSMEKKPRQQEQEAR